MAGLEKTSMKMAEEMGVPERLMENMAEMSAAMELFMQDPSNVDLLLPFLDTLQNSSSELEEDFGVLELKAVQSMGYNSSEEMMKDISEDDTMNALLYK